MKVFPRTTTPNGGIYYNNAKQNGKNPCITGSPTDSRNNVLHNCVGYAVGRFNEIHDEGTCALLGNINAGKMDEIAKKQGLKTGTEPKEGACIVWEKIGGAGHVAIVEEIGNDYIITSESGWKAKKAFWTTKRKKGGNWGQNSDYKFVCFIYQPERTCTRVLSYGTKCERVKVLQQYLKKLSLYSGEIDGSYGKQTLAAVLMYQFFNEIKIDGIAGSETQKHLTGEIL